MMKKLFALSLGLLFSALVINAQQDSLTMEEIKEKSCQVVTQYQQFKKYLKNISNESLDPELRRANVMALRFLLDHDFTITDNLEGFNKGYSRESFITALMNKAISKDFFERTFENFDCPDTSKFGLKQVSAIFDGEYFAKVYKGKLYYAEYSLNAYEVVRGSNERGANISREDKIKSLAYQFRKGSRSDSYKIKIKGISTVPSGTRVESFRLRDSQMVRVYEKLDANDFEPCCDAPPIPDSDGDGFHDLIDCHPSNDRVYPGAPICVNYPDHDRNCNGMADGEEFDVDEDGFTVAQGDCNDEDPTVYPFAEIQPFNNWPDDNCDGIPDDTTDLVLPKLNLSDYLLVGKGHFIRGPQNPVLRKGTAIAYAAGFTGALTTSIVFKIRSEQSYQKHLSTTFIRELDEEYAKANDAHKIYVVAGAAAASIFISQAIHLYVKDRTQKRRFKESFQGVPEAIEIDSDPCVWIPGATENGLGLIIKF